jgi:hypothetical protein
MDIQPSNPGHRLRHYFGVSGPFFGGFLVGGAVVISILRAPAERRTFLVDFRIQPPAKLSVQQIVKAMALGP